ncbi:hypothetical protein K7X08_022198 [Anisodus acutangulus]|uniref:Uncharacterized protein n=1 Tax=Anisodus acutangulus TaxID=402998 RepID=A0A9Q1L6N2_9SOLA|nr:hypothetical protein K7X08_022198 [Anisodus acutangulus]
MTKKDTRKGDVKGKENMTSTQEVVIQNNFNVLENITKEEVNGELNGGNNTALEVIVSKYVVDINKEIEKEGIYNKIHIDIVDMGEHKDIEEGPDMVNSADSQDKEEDTRKGLNAYLEKSEEHQVGVTNTVEFVSTRQWVDNIFVVTKTEVVNYKYNESCALWETGAMK